MQFSKRLKMLRLELGYTQKELAELLNISQSSYAKYEKGITKPKFARLEELATIFDVSISYLLGETNTRTSSTLNETLDFPKRIKILRLEAGYTQKELAEKLNMSSSGYSSYGSEVRPTFPRTARLEKMADIFNVSVSYLLGETNERPFITNDKPSSFSDRLKELRIQSGYSQAEISKKLNLSSRQVYNNYEKGVNKPQKETLEKLADFFEVSVEYLLNGTQKPKPSKPE